MKKIIFFFLILSFFPCNLTFGQRSTKQKTMLFQFVEKDLIEIIYQVAALKDINVVLPQGAQKIDVKVSWSLEKPVSVDEAWTLLGTFLAIAGYSVVPDGKNYQIVKDSPNVSREPMPVFINTPIDQLPHSEQRIRYVYYLSNIRGTTDPNDELNAVLKELLPQDAIFKIDPDTNAIVAAARSNDLQAAMQIVKQLDQAGTPEKLSIVRLNYTSAATVANLFNENILKPAQGANRYRLDTQKPSEASYFSKNVRLIPYNRTNSVILLGRSDAIKRIKEFIHDYIDVELGTGKSILHVFKLQYLDAVSFAEVLRRVVTPTQVNGAQGQAGQLQQVGPERYFQDVIISIDRPTDIQEPATTAEGARIPTPYFGGNKLIIAAREDDWKRIKKLIEELDTPQTQVYIEVLIADLTIDDQRALGSIVRNPAKIPLPNEMEFQAAQLNPGIIPNSFDNPQTIGVIEKDGIAADLLRLFTFDANGNRIDCAGANCSSAASVPPAGSAIPGTTVVSLNDNDGKTWGILQVLKLFNNIKIISHPHVVAVNHQPAKIEQSQIRLVQGGATGQLGNTIIKTDNIEAKLQIKLTPRISPSVGTERAIVNLYVEIDIDQFIPGNVNNARLTRKIITEANVRDGDILSLGGLIAINDTNAQNETPVLSQIPIIGWLFKQRSAQEAKNNLTVFISPTIIQARLREGAGAITQEYLQVAQEYVREGTLFDTLRDPVNRFFFKPTEDSTEIVQRFIAKDETLREVEYDPNNDPYYNSSRPRKKKRYTIPEPDEQPLDDPGVTQNKEVPFDKEQYVASLKNLLND